MSRYNKLSTLQAALLTRKLSSHRKRHTEVIHILAMDTSKLIAAFSMKKIIGKSKQKIEELHIKLVKAQRTSHSRYGSILRGTFYERTDSALFFFITLI